MSVVPVKEQALKLTHHCTISIAPAPGKSSILLAQSIRVFPRKKEGVKEDINKNDNISTLFKYLKSQFENSFQKIKKLHTIAIINHHYDFFRST